MSRKKIGKEGKRKGKQRKKMVQRWRHRARKLPEKEGRQRRRWKRKKIVLRRRSKNP